MIELTNGTRIFVNHSMKKDIYIGISEFGFEKDIKDEIIGIAHLLEHILISFNSKYFTANAVTSRTYMSFWCKSLYVNGYEDAIKTATSWFFDSNMRLKTDFSKVALRNYIAELENEYYYRTEMYHCMDVLTYLYGGDLYNGGRITMLGRLAVIRKMLSDRMKHLYGKNIVIFIKKLNTRILELLVNTFGNIPKYPDLISLDPELQDTKQKIILMPYPFYTLLIQVRNNLNNLLAILCLVENYNLIDYETIGDRLYISISFTEEDQYEYFLYNVQRISFRIDRVELDLGEDYLMNIYVNFPWLKNDIYEYIRLMTIDNKTLLEDLKRDIRESIQGYRFMIIYPSFAKLLYNITDKQDHSILVVDDVTFKNGIVNLNMTYNISNSYSVDNLLYRKTSLNNIVISYSDNCFSRYALFYHFLETRYRASATFSKTKTKVGVCYKHRFSNDDLNDLVNSETFIKYNNSKPAVLYQYILLAYFVTEKDIKDILDCSDQILQIDMIRSNKNKLLFGKNTRYDIYTKSTFVCGLLKGSKLTEKIIVEYMWRLKRLGLIYHLDYTKLEIPNTYYFFTFTIFVEKVYHFFTKLTEVASRCLVVSTKNTKSLDDDFSSLNKQIVINIK
ncbi:ORF-44 [Teiidae poxvirus 1]|nr:ORF-44 [Teiidae poxvirus 1]